VLRDIELDGYEIIFDGGSLGNPGRGYGSFRIQGPNDYEVHVSLNFDDRGMQVTNNQAEYLSLIQALNYLHHDLGHASGRAAVTIRGDSQLVINQINRSWKVRHPDLRNLFEQVTELMARFGKVDAVWHPRTRTVAVLGH
jgi:ribonuclease HI